MVQDGRRYGKDGMDRVKYVACNAGSTFLVAQMTVNEKLKVINKFISLSNAFDDTASIQQAILSFRPFKDAWSIIEQVVHCVEFDVANFHRYRWAIAEPETQVLSFDGSWTNILNYQQTIITDALDTIKVIRKIMGSHLKQIANDDWLKYVYTFGPGKRFNLEESIVHFNDHVGFHRELIDRNIKLFNERIG